MGRGTYLSGYLGIQYDRTRTRNESPKGAALTKSICDISIDNMHWLQMSQLIQFRDAKTREEGNPGICTGYYFWHPTDSLVPGGM